MEYNDKRKNTTAAILKTLRTSYKDGRLSHEKLSELLSRNYYKGEYGEILRRHTPDNTNTWKNEPIISKSTLKEYELKTSENSNKSRLSKGFGMGISNLIMLADFYEVSIDYLLGMPAFPGADQHDGIINMQIGLTSDAINILKKMHSKYPQLSDAFSKFISSVNFIKFINCLKLIENEKSSYNDYINNLAEEINTTDMPDFAQLLESNYYRMQLSPIYMKFDETGKRELSIEKHIELLLFKAENIVSDMLKEISCIEEMDWDHFINEILKLLNQDDSQAYLFKKLLLEYALTEQFKYSLYKEKVEDILNDKIYKKNNSELNSVEVNHGEHNKD